MTHADSRHDRTVLTRKDVAVLEGTGPASIAGTAPMRVSALHSRTVARLGVPFRSAARDGGGLIHAVGRSRPPFARWRCNAQELLFGPAKEGRHPDG